MFCYGCENGAQIKAHVYIMSCVVVSVLADRNKGHFIDSATGPSCTGVKVTVVRRMCATGSS